MGIIQDKVSSSIIIISIVLKMYYNGYNDYNDIYELDLGENPSLKFKYYDVTNGAFVIGITTTLVRSTLNVNEKGYYYRLYHATDNNIYNLDFRIVFKVGDPVDGEARVPQEHIRYNHDSTWEDQLISYGEIVYIDGVPQTETTIQEYTYDSQGNPIAITNFQYGGYTSISVATLSWSGRELTSIYIPLTQGDSITIEYTYNDQGYRIKKVITSNFDSQISMETIEYELIEDKVIYETNGTYGILFTYDYDGTLISFDYDPDITDQDSGSEYFYIRNQMGDITHIATSDGTVVVRYFYDVYGNIIDTDITSGYNAVANANPYRYRGYRYDKDINMYYLNSRYYNPQIGRFINADGMPGQFGDIQSTNMYAYCANNPVMYLDPSGEIAWPIIVIGVIVVVYVVGLIVHSIGSDPASDSLYDTPDEAAIAWKNEYQSQSQDKEYSAILYSKESDGIIKYYYGRTYEGYSNNCIPGLFYGYTTGLFGNIFSSRQTVGFIHSHPQPPEGYYNDFFSKPDLWVINLSGIDYMYLVPYTNSGYSTQPTDTRFIILW